MTPPEPTHQPQQPKQENRGGQISKRRRRVGAVRLNRDEHRRGKRVLFSFPGDSSGIFPALREVNSGRRAAGGTDNRKLMFFVSYLNEDGEESSGKVETLGLCCQGRGLLLRTLPSRIHVAQTGGAELVHSGPAYGVATLRPSFSYRLLTTCRHSGPASGPARLLLTDPLIRRHPGVQLFWRPSARLRC